MKGTPPPNAGCGMTAAAVRSRFRAFFSETAISGFDPCKARRMEEEDAQETRGCTCRALGAVG